MNEANIITPVIHCLGWEQIDKNLKVCLDSGIEMVFLINHSTAPTAVSDLGNWYIKAREAYPTLKFGLNFLQLTTRNAVMIGEELGVGAIWTDYQVTHKKTTDILVFGGVAFKYQKQVRDDELETVCKEAIDEMDVITTSGPATGIPANIDKIKRIRSYIGNHPLAIASGISVENKKIFEPYVDYMLVASSITDDDELIIKERLVELMEG